MPPMPGFPSWTGGYVGLKQPQFCHRHRTCRRNGVKRSGSRGCSVRGEAMPPEMAAAGGDWAGCDPVPVPPEPGRWALANDALASYDGVEILSVPAGMGRIRQRRERSQGAGFGGSRDGDGDKQPPRVLARQGQGRGQGQLATEDAGTAGMLPASRTSRSSGCRIQLTRN